MDKKGVIGIIFCVVLLILWQPLMVHLGVIEKTPSKDGVDERPQEETADEEDSASRDTPNKEETGTGESLDPDDGGDSRKQGGQVSKGDSPSVEPSPGDFPAFARSTASLDADDEKLRSGDYLTAYFDRHKGGIMGTVLKKYWEPESGEKDEGERKHVRLGTGGFPYCRLIAGENGYELGSGTLRKTDEGDAVILKRRAKNSALVVIEKWKLKSEKPYRLAYTVTFRNQGDAEVNIGDYVVAAGDMRPVKTGGRSKLAGVGLNELTADVAFVDTERPVSYSGGDVRSAGIDKRRELATREFQWIALHNKYFLYFLQRKDGSLPGFRLHSRKPEDGPKTLAAQVALPARKLAPRQDTTLTFNAYAGPKKLNYLNETAQNLDQVMNLDLFLFFHASWMQWITEPILRSLLAINDFLGHKWGYGFAIIVITIVIKTLFWPLTHRSTVSMRKMQKIQPLIKELREKYKDEPQKMQQKTMELYREHKVNPAGGCLPIFFQLPVFFALFNTLRNAVELRQAAFLWVHDLSMPDTVFQIPLFFELPMIGAFLPIRPLAIFMAVTMFFQQRIMSSGDPQQKKMMTFMTIGFFFVFYTMPAGLTLYWSTNQTITIFQNLISHRILGAREED